MKCERVRELVLTDYLDGRLPAVDKEVIDNHCASCAPCREFLQEAAGAQECLRSSGELEAPARVWENISRALDDERQVPVFERVFNRIAGFVFSHRPAVAVMTVVTVLVMSGLALRLPAYRAANNRRAVNAYLEEQAAFYLTSNGSEAFEESLSLGSGQVYF
jgi:predicted anti-sigma-YlaC factor YlaD